MKTNKITGPAPYMLPEDKGSDTERGLIVASNDSRFVAGNAAQELTNLALGVSDRENLEAELNRVAPAVPAPRRFSYRVAEDAVDFLTEGDDVRAIGSSFKRVQSTGTEQNGKTLNKGLTVVLDKDEMLPGDEERWVGRLTRRLMRNELVRSYALLIAAAGTVGNKVWNGTANPDGDVASLISDGGDDRGTEANTVVYGGSAWLYRFLSYSAAGRTNGGANAALMPEQLAALLQVDNVIVSKSRKVSGTTKNRILGSYVLSYYAEQNATREDASNIKRFFTPAAGGRIGVYREEKSKTIEISVEHYSNIIITSTLGIKAVTVSQSQAQG